MAANITLSLSGNRPGASLKGALNLLGAARPPGTRRQPESRGATFLGARNPSEFSLARWAALLAWFFLWRAPFFRGLPDFFDSPGDVRRITLGWSYALHFPGGHFPFQGMVFGPAALLYAAAGGALESAQCIALVSLVYGVVAFAALVVLWRRFFPGAAGGWAMLLYPLFAGPALADLSVYSVSATNAFLFGGSALLAEGLARLCHLRARAWALCLGASVSFGLGLYTHLIPALWASIPAFIVLAHLLAAPPMRCERCATATWSERLRESALFGVPFPSASRSTSAPGSRWSTARAQRSPRFASAPRPRRRGR